MRVFRGTDKLSLEQSVVTIGQFDGLHLGHQHLIKQAVEKAADLGCTAGLVSFYPLPAQKFYNAQRMQRPVDKMKIAASLGLDFVVWLNFNSVRAMSAAEFVTVICQQKLGAAHVVVGSDFRFGHDRVGTPEFMQQAGIDVSAVSLIEYGGQKVSSNEIRQALSAKNFNLVAKLLGREFCFSAKTFFDGQVKALMPGEIFSGDLDVLINDQKVKAQACGRYLILPAEFANKHIEIRPIG